MTTELAAESSLATNNDSLATPLLLSNGNDDDDVKNRPWIGDDAPLCRRRLWFFRFVYFLSGLNNSAWGRLGVVYYNRVQRLSAFRIGVLEGVTPLAGLLFTPVWGFVADRMRSRKRVYLVCQLVSTASLISLPIVPQGDFGWTLVCVLGMASFKSGNVLDAHTLDFLGDEHRESYGTIRLFMSISFGLGGVLMGWIADVYGFDWNFLLYGALRTAVLLVVAAGLPVRSRSEQESYDRAAENTVVGDGNDGDDTKRELRRLLDGLLRAPVLLFLAEVAVLGAGVALVESFLFVYLENDLGASALLCGGTVGVTVTFSVPIFLNSAFLLRTIGHDGLFLLAEVAYVVRVFGYTFLTPSTVRNVYLLEVLHGVTYACAWTASVDYSARAAPPGLATTFQTILGATMQCLGGGVAPVVGGAVMDRYGARTMYRGAGAMVSCVLTAHVIACACGRDHAAALRRSETRRRKEDAETITTNDDGTRADALTESLTTVSSVRSDDST